MSEVDFVVNCYERTYRDVLGAGYVRRLAGRQGFPFASVTVLVNNVRDRADAERLAASCDVDRVVFVADALPAALARTRFPRRHLRRLPHFTDCCLAAATLAGPEWFCYWDAEADLREPHDWISPTLSFMQTNPQVGVGNPNTWLEGLAVREALRIDGDIAVGYGFSDVAFLARRSDLGSPIYGKVAPASWRYPLAHVEPIFEQQVDAWMRRTGRQRATYLPATVTHPDEVGGNYPAAGLRERIRGRLMRSVGQRASRISAHPAMRAWN